MYEALEQTYKCFRSEKVIYAGEGRLIKVDVHPATKLEVFRFDGIKTTLNVYSGNYGLALMVYKSPSSAGKVIITTEGIWQFFNDGELDYHVNKTATIIDYKYIGVHTFTSYRTLAPVMLVPFNSLKIPVTKENLEELPSIFSVTSPYHPLWELRRIANPDFVVPVKDFLENSQLKHCLPKMIFDEVSAWENLDKFMQLKRIETMIEEVSHRIRPEMPPKPMW